MSSYIERMNEVMAEARKEVKEKGKAIKYNISDKEMEIARALHELLGMPQFKKYLEFENNLIGEIMTNIFNVSTELEKKKSYGEAVAKNEGRYEQMMALRFRREELLKRYIYIIENDNIKKGE